MYFSLIRQNWYRKTIYLRNQWHSDYERDMNRNICFLVSEHCVNGSRIFAYNALQVLDVVNTCHFTPLNLICFVLTEWFIYVLWFTVNILSTEIKTELKAFGRMETSMLHRIYPVRCLLKFLTNIIQGNIINMRINYLTKAHFE